MPPAPLPSFATRLIDWQRTHGRHGLPWQGTRDPYRVWLSEIMLQQTQVQTVLAYFPRFIQRFADVQALAAASADEVMQLWSGLGYYSRARNLHRAAGQVVAQFGGQFPSDIQALQSLPGIGRSTAHAIAAFCAGERVSIFDANVQRVVARYLAFEGDLAQAAHVRQLWALADGLLPAPDADLRQAMPAYTQGLMDLGATTCTPRRPQCPRCPVAQDCRALRTERVLSYPVKTRKLKRSSETWYWLVLADGPLHAPGTHVLLEKRPERGIWAGLHCFAVLPSQEALLARLAHCTEAAALAGWPGLTDQAAHPAPAVQWQNGFRHVLTHKDLLLIPTLARLPHAGAWPRPALCAGPQEHGAPLRWVAVGDILSGAVATPAPLLAWLKAQQSAPAAQLPIKFE